MKSKGFTLIELVVVIIILGILAVAVAPKFLNISRDARIASLDGFVGAVKSANSIVMSKAVLAGVASAKVETNIPNTDLYVLDGNMSIKPEHIEAAMNVDGFMITDYSLNERIPSAFVYLGDKKLEYPELRAMRCSVLLSRSVVGGDIVTRELQVEKIYDGC
ncbi:type II secretion system protein [Shewanella gelidimarina]|uniref:type II secretion system protein n=1 Tax=Shewanella gelidimarina TaxID=56813 RepID=UPI0024B0573B|nr:prepilin-type N-terminal cleavage/methylation domain-containing protein [Shewanella gelidimarina]